MHETPNFRSTPAGASKANPAIMDAGGVAPERIATNSNHVEAKAVRSRRPGEEAELVRGALNALHKYDHGSVQIPGPFSSRQIAAKAEVAPASVLNFWKKKFRSGRSGDGTYRDYENACRTDRIGFVLSHINGDAPARDVVNAVNSLRNYHDDD
jgi:hypothetical protein